MSSKKVTIGRRDFGADEHPRQDTQKLKFIKLMCIL